MYLEFLDLLKHISSLLAKAIMDIMLGGLRIWRCFLDVIRGVTTKEFKAANFGILVILI